MQLKKATKKTLRAELFFLSCTLGSRPPLPLDFFLVFSLSREKGPAPAPSRIIFLFSLNQDSRLVPPFPAPLHSSLTQGSPATTPSHKKTAKATPTSTSNSGSQDLPYAQKPSISFSRSPAPPNRDRPPFLSSSDRTRRQLPLSSS